MTHDAVIASEYDLPWWKP
nr:hypothetical protein [Paenibacillus hemerocallicola]